MLVARALATASAASVEDPDLPQSGATPADASTAAVKRVWRKGLAMIDHVGRGVLDQMPSATRSVPHHNLLTFSVGPPTPS